MLVSLTDSETQVQSRSNGYDDGDELLAYSKYICSLHTLAQFDDIHNVRDYDLVTSKTFIPSN